MFLTVSRIKVNFNPESEIFKEEYFMASKDGKIFDTVVYIGLSVNGLTAIYLLLMYFEII